MSNREIRESLVASEARVKELEAQLTVVLAEKQAAETKAAELEAAAAAAPAKKLSKGMEQALAAKALLESGDAVTLVQMSKLNEKYPNDPVYYARTLLGLNIKTNKVKGGKTTYKLVVATEAPAAPAPQEQAPEVPTEAPVTEVPAPVVAQEFAETMAVLADASAAQ